MAFVMGCTQWLNVKETHTSSSCKTYIGIQTVGAASETLGIRRLLLLRVL